MIWSPEIFRGDETMESHPTGLNLNWNIICFFSHNQKWSKQVLREACGMSPLTKKYQCHAPVESLLIIHSLKWAIRWTNLSITGHQGGRTLLSCLKISCLRLKCISLHLKHREAPPEIKKDTWARLLDAYKGNPRHIDPFTGSFKPYQTRQNIVKWDSIRATILLGGLAETTPEDGSVGPLFACIIKKQVLFCVQGDPKRL